MQALAAEHRAACEFEAQVRQCQQANRLAAPDVPVIASRRRRQRRLPHYATPVVRSSWRERHHAQVVRQHQASRDAQCTFRPDVATVTESRELLDVVLGGS
eukprot:COSAG01_NODE_699_length_14176_cov_21.100590_11_plen_101_part_00